MSGNTIVPVCEQPVLVEHIEVAEGRYAALLRLNRPEKLNAINWELLAGLSDALTEAGADNRVCAVLLTGCDGAFCAGGDLTLFIDVQRDADAFPRLVARMHEVLRQMRHLRVPVVALVNGVAAAGGLELMLSADFCIAARSARIGDGHLRFGQMGGGGVLTLLPRLIGPARARELVFSARLLDAEEALSWGLVNRVVGDDGLIAEGAAFAADVAALSPLAVANAKMVVNLAWERGTGVDAGLDFEVATTQYYALTSNDAREGLAAFAANRSPRFTGD